MPAYHNNLLRHKALEVIKEDLQATFKEEFDLTDILKKINNIRSQFLEVLRKKNVQPPSGSGTEDFVRPSWWLYEHLSFLLPYTKKDKGESNLIQTQLSNDAALTEKEMTDNVSISYLLN